MHWRTSLLDWWPIGIFPNLGSGANNLFRFSSNLRKETWFVPKKVMPIHAVARLVLSFTTFLRNAFRPYKLQSTTSFLGTMTHRLDDDASGTMTDEEDGPCFRLGGRCQRCVHRFSYKKGEFWVPYAFKQPILLDNSDQTVRVVVDPVFGKGLLHRCIFSSDSPGSRIFWIL